MSDWFDGSAHDPYFANRDAHRTALDRAAIDRSERELLNCFLPSLVLTPQELLAAVLPALVSARPLRRWPDWIEVALERTDPRAPWLPKVGFARHCPVLGQLLVRPVDSMLAWELFVLRNQYTAVGVTAHRLTDHDRQPLRFTDPTAALYSAETIVFGPDLWSWEPRIGHGLDGGWSPLPADLPGKAKAWPTRRGTKGLWQIRTTLSDGQQPPCVTVLRDGQQKVTKFDNWRSARICVEWAEAAPSDRSLS